MNNKLSIGHVASTTVVVSAYVQTPLLVAEFARLSASRLRLDSRWRGMGLIPLRSPDQA